MPRIEVTTDVQVPIEVVFDLSRSIDIHDHKFETKENGITRMTDVFDYTSPLGFLGRIADKLFLENYMRRLLQERNLVIKKTAERKRMKS